VKVKPILPVQYCLYAEVGNVTSKFDGVTHYRSSHALRAITIKSDNVSDEPRAITLRSDNDFNKPRAITTKAVTFFRVLKHYAITQKCNIALSQQCVTVILTAFFTHPIAYWMRLPYPSNPNMPASAASVRKRRREVKVRPVRCITVRSDNYFITLER
jgi:hypothetical protein